MNGNQPQEPKKIVPKEELERIRIQIQNSEHNLQMLKVMEKKLEEMSR